MEFVYNDCMRLKLLSVLLLVMLVLKVAPVAYGQDYTDAQKKEIEKKIQEYQSKLSSIRTEKNTLSSQIQYMDTQIYLTGLNIIDTEQKIKQTEKEIGLLSTRIDGLDTSLNTISKLLIERVVDGYKEHTPSLFDMVLDSGNADTLLAKIQYQRVAQSNNQKMLVQVQEAKLNFEEQKNLREKKKEELDKLTVTLNEQKVALNAQKESKQRLLAVTQNDEATYQKLLDDAQKQLAGFKSFVQTAGGGAVAANAFGTGSDGWYYTQRDSRWAGKTIGSSSDTVLEVGCLLTDIAMMMKKDGVNYTPYDVAANTNYFFSNTAFMLHPSNFSWPNGKKYVNISIGSIEDQIKNGHPVIAGLYAGKFGTHYVILKQVDGNDYIMHDPYYGPDKKFSDYYSKGSIFVAAIFQ